ncbi:MAG: acyltransferase [Proteobacteria bacterium]|nr:MAG: acyltransferase [Pseudomonadota bacterium]
MSNGHIRYRTDIDGIRAIAIISVVLFHISETLFPSGFAGVDVFFVISGYLISGNIYRELDRDAFSFKRFYARRIRRLYPALMVMLTSCLIFGWFALFKREFKVLGAELLAGTAFFANFKLYFESGYFDQSAQLKPLLHLWSLSLEEQFYFCLPILLIVWVPLRRSVGALLVITAMFFAFSYWLTYQNTSMAFYFPTRFWELLMGSLLASIELYNGERVKNLKSGITALVGLVLVTVGVTALGGSENFPGWKAVVPTLGTFLLIFAGPSNKISKLIGNKLFVAVGLISYPLYLWHWPLLYFGKMGFAGNDETIHRVAAVCLAVIFSIGTYFLVERPLRENKSKRVLIGLLIWNACLLGLGSAAKDHGNSNDESSLMTLNSRRDELTEKTCPFSEALSKRALWCFSDKRGKNDSVMIGDSHADAFYIGLIQDHSLQRWSFIGRSGCPPIYRVTHEEHGGWKADDAKDCSDIMMDITDELAENGAIKNVMLVATSNHLLMKKNKFTDLDDKALDSDSSLFNGYAKNIQKLLAAGKKVIILVDNPHVTETPELCLTRPLRFTEQNFKDCSITRSQHLAASREYLEMVGKLQQRFPELLVFDPIDEYCDQEVCPVLDDGKSLFAYTDHISDHANQKVGAAFLKWFENKR